MSVPREAVFMYLCMQKRISLILLHKKRTVSVWSVCFCNLGMKIEITAEAHPERCSFIESFMSNFLMEYVRT